MGKANNDAEEMDDPLEQLRNFVITSKVRAFIDKYEPCDENDGVMADRVFDDATLRKFFNAYPKACGDPLMIYIDEHLAPAGFRFTVSEMTGEEPVILVRVRS